MPAWGSAQDLNGFERALKARLIDLGFGMNRAFSADGFVIITDPGAMPQANMKSAPMALNTYVRGEQTAALSSEPEIDQQNHKKRGQNQPRDHNDFHPQVANRGNVVVDIRILVKESVTIEKDVGAANQIR